MKKLTLSLFALLAAALCSQAQTILVPTTLSASISSSTQVLTVASVTTVSGYTVVAGTVLYIDNEMLVVKPLNGTVSGTTLAVIRGQGGTAAGGHASGALVFVGPPNAFDQKPGSNPLAPAGATTGCTRGNLLYLPYINTRAGEISDCLNGSWVKGVRTAAPKFRVAAPEPGSGAYTSINTNGTAPSASTMYCSELYLPASKLLTGAAILAGTTVATDKWMTLLYDSGGNLIANSAVAGVTTATGSTYQQRAFTAKYFATGPAQYYVCMQSNGTTDTIRMAITGVNDNLLTASQSSVTFGTTPALTVPTSFTTAVGPYAYVY